MFNSHADLRRRLPAPLGGLGGQASPIIELVAVPVSRELALLIHRSAADDTRAFAELYDATAARVYGLALRILGSPVAAEEVTLQSYLEVWGTSGRFDAGECSAMAWILAILLRRVAGRLDSGPGTPQRLPGAVEVARRQVQATSEETEQILEALAWLRPGQLIALEFVCRDGEDAPLTTILSTLVDATLWEGLRRMDGTTYKAPVTGARDPERFQ